MGIENIQALFPYDVEEEAVVPNPADKIVDPVTEPI